MTNHIAFHQFCSAIRRKAALALCLALCILGPGLSAGAQKRTIMPFDVTPTSPDPLPGTEAGQGTFPLGINPAGAITGYYIDASNMSHGFLRAPHGKFTTIDVRGADTGAYQGTWSFAGITPAGAIVGWYIDTNGVSHGFPRTP